MTKIQVTALLIRNTLLCCICTSTNWISPTLWSCVTVSIGLSAQIMAKCSKHKACLCTPKGYYRLH